MMSTSRRKTRSIPWTTAPRLPCTPGSNANVAVVQLSFFYPRFYPNGASPADQLCWKPGQRLPLSGCHFLEEPAPKRTSHRKRHSIPVWETACRLKHPTLQRCPAGHLRGLGGGGRSESHNGGIENSR